MANPTTNFGWVMPTSASLVTNLPADFNTFGQGVDTSMAQLKGGTTGQVLSKTSGTDMAFTWVTPTDQTPLTTKGDLFAFSTVDARLAVGANETRLVADSTQTVGLKYVADTTNYAINAKADLLVGTAADTLAALTVGTNGQVLTADSTVSPTGLKWATPASGSTAKGVSVFGSSGSQGIPNNTWTAITWDSETFDTDAFHSTSSNTSRFTVPSGLAGKYSIKMQLLFNLNATGYRNIRLYKNGAAVKEGNEVTGSSAQYVGSYINADLDLIVGDYIELFAYQNCGTTLNTYTTVLDSTYSMMYWGA